MMGQIPVLEPNPAMNIRRQLPLSEWLDHRILRPIKL
jgi:hypothetical protein